MFILLLFTAFAFDYHKCARPRSVNLAVETVLEFDKHTDMSLVDTAQKIINKIRTTLEGSREFENTRRRNTFKFSDFFEESVGILRSYNDIDLKYLLSAVEDEVNDLENCKDNLESDLELRRYLNDKLTQLKNVTSKDIRRNLNDVMRKLQDEEYKRNSVLINFLNSLFSKGNNKFRIILNDMQLYRRRGTNSRATLRSMVKNTIGVIITDYYCNLKRENRREIKNLLDFFLRNTRTKPRKRKSKERKLSLRNEERNRNNTLIKDLRDTYNQYRQNFLKVQNYYNIKDSWNAKKLKEPTTTQRYSSQEDSQEKYIKPDHERNIKKKVKDKYILREITNDYWSTDTTKFAFQNELASINNDYVKPKNKKKRKFKTTTDDYLQLYIEPSKKESNYDIKETELKRNKEKKILKPNKILLEVFTTAPQTTEPFLEKGKKFLKKLVFKDSNSDVSSKSKEDLPVWQKPTTKESHNNLKTFITLYPKRIDIYNLERKTTELVRKRYKIKHSNNTTTKNAALITSSSEIDIDIDGSFVNTSNSGGHIKTKKHHHKFGQKHSRPRKFRGRKHKKKSRYLSKKRNRTTTSSNMRAINDSGSIEHFGSLHSYRNRYKKKPEPQRHFRKNNDMDLLQITNVAMTDVSSTTDIKEDVENTTVADVFSDELTSTYFGTLAFWSGTERSTFNPIISTDNATKNLSNSTSNTQTFETTSDILPPTQIVFRSHTINNTIESENVSKITKFDNDTISSTIQSTTEEKQLNTTTTLVSMKENATLSSKNFTLTTMTPLDLRRYMETIHIEGELEEGKKMEIKNKIRKDLEKVLRTTPVFRFKQKDDIDKIEEMLSF